MMKAAKVSRPSKGLSFEEALERWSPPWDYAALQEVDGFKRAPLDFLLGPRDAERYQYLHRRATLERELFARLARAKLLSSAITDASDPSDPRVLVHPALYDRNVSYDRLKDTVETGGMILWSVEIFEPNALPSNVTRMPEWLEQFVGTSVRTPSAAGDAAPAPVADEFRPDAAYAHVTLRGVEFTLNSTQAGIVRVLHRAALDGRRWVSVEELRQEVGFKYQKLSGAFRHMKNPSWRELILSDDRGAYRLNI